MANSFKQKSDETWKNGTDCLDNEMGNMAANRLYYAVFQSIKGYAIFHGLWREDEKIDVHGKALNIVCDPIRKGKAWGWRAKLQELRGLRERADYQAENVDINEIQELVESVDVIRRKHIDDAV